MCWYGKLRIYSHGETGEAVLRGKAKRVANPSSLPTPMKTQSQVILRCMDLRVHCIICAGKASFLQDSDWGTPS